MPQPDARSDDAALATMGYEQQLARGIRSWVVSAAFGFTAIGTIPFTGIDLVLSDGGPAAALGAWLVTSFFTIITTFSIAELCSAFPNSGAMYHWVGQLAPACWVPIISFATGTLLCFGFVSNIATSAAGCAYWTSTIVSSRYGGSFEVIAISTTFAVVAAWSLVNTQRVKTLSRCFSVSALLQIVCGIVVIVTMFSLNPPTGGVTPWLAWENTTGFSNTYASFLSISNAIQSFSGYDVRLHSACRGLV